VRWVDLADERGVGLRATGPGVQAFGAHHYSIAELEAATHTHELSRQGPVTLTLDHAHCGVGSGSCGPWTLPEHRVPVEDYEFTVDLRPFAEGG
jgi:beta-galactosidase/evolved beta-galactosidase subunit alpha